MSRSTTVRTRRSPRTSAAEGSIKPRRHGEILDAAARVFAEKGFHGATTQDVADVLGIRQASLYYYVASKEIALEQVCITGAEGFYDMAKRIFDGEGGPREKLELLMRWHVSPLRDRADYVRVFLNERQHLPSTSRRKVGRWSRGLERIFEKVITEGIAGGVFSKEIEPRLATLALLGMLNAVPYWVAKENRDLDTVSDQLVRIAIGGLATTRP